MQLAHKFIRNSILSTVDTFYPPFKYIMPLQTFRYAACGGANTLLDIILFALCYNFVVEKDNVYLRFITISPHIFSFIVAFCITFPIGFYLSRYVVWQSTQTKKRIQFFRYFLVVMACVLMNYIFLKLFIEYFGWWPTFSKVITSVIVITFSYFTQRHYSFKISNA